jgi:prepilin-type N-terminal cleavage/methylation domain-containing protein
MMRDHRGFTLIEVLVAVGILAVLSFYTAQSIQKAVQSKVKVQGDIERISTLRDAMKIIEKDIETAFNYRDPNIELYNKAGKAREARSKQPAKPSPNPNDQGKPEAATPAPPDAPTNPTGEKAPFQERKQVILTQWLGEADNFHFTSLNNMRSQKDSPISDQMEVGYFLKTCRNRVNSSLTSQCLIRRTSSIVDDDVSVGGDEIALLENVIRFEVRYMGYQEGAEWQSTWKSDANGDSVTKDHFPLAVEVTLEVKDGPEAKAKKTAMTIVAEIRNPNNPVTNAIEGGGEEQQPSPTGQLPGQTSTPTPEGTPLEE